jgi:Tfp pilus assembly protein PilO
MSSNRQILLGALGLLALVSVMARMFIWPGYREAASVRQKCATLRTKIAGLGDENQQVHLLAEQVEQARRRVSLAYKNIPQTPDVAELIRKLSLPVDGVSVIDQTFTAGTPEDVNVGNERHGAPLKIMPLKVEMSATFDSVFALMRAAESMNRLMRVSSLKVSCKRDEKAQGAAASNERMPILTATVGLEAVFDPPDTGTEEEH